jgi:hypothetical protein
MNAAEMVQHGPQQMLAVTSLGGGPGRRKFHCVFKDSRAR